MPESYARTHGAPAPGEAAWDDLPVLLAAAREGSLTGAARRLGVNQSTASRRLQALEAAVGGRLFDRRPDGLVPTALALALLPHAEAAQDAVDGFRRTAAGQDPDPGGTVRLAVPDGLDSLLLAPSLPAFFARHPRIRLEIVASPALSNLARREADLALRFVRPTVGDLVARRLLDLPQGLFGTAACAAGGAQAPWIAWDEELGQVPEAAFEARHGGERIVLRLNRIEARLAAARAGVGLAVLPLAVAKLAPELVAVDPGAPVPGCALWLVAHRALMPAPRVRAVWDFLVEVGEGTVG